MLDGIAFGALILILLAVGIIVFVILYQRRVINHQVQLKDFNRKKQQELMEASIRSEEEERMRVAAELHDDVGATLSSIRLLMGQAARNPGDGSVLNAARELLDDTIQKVRNISHQLQPGTLQYLGLAKSLQSLADLLSRTGRLKVTCGTSEGWVPLEPSVELALYRIVQELINNIIKHSGATTLTIDTSVTDTAACILLSHDGEGLTNESYKTLLHKPGAIGLKNIETRLKSAGADISFLPLSADKHSVRLSVPLTSAPGSA